MSQSLENLESAGTMPDLQPLNLPSLALAKVDDPLGPIANPRPLAD